MQTPHGDHWWWVEGIPSKEDEEKYPDVMEREDLDLVEKHRLIKVKMKVEEAFDKIDELVMPLFKEVERYRGFQLS